MPARRAAASSGRSFATSSAAAATHLAVGAGFHTLAHGCPPEARSLTVTVPVGLLAVAAADRLLSQSGRPVRLAGCQVVVHTILTVLAVCVSGASHAQSTHAHEQGASAAAAAAILMLSAHALAVVVCVLVLHRVERAAADAARRAADMVEALVAAVTAHLSARPVPAAPQRGPLLCMLELTAPASVALLVETPRGPPVRAG